MSEEIFKYFHSLEVFDWIQDSNIDPFYFYHFYISPNFPGARLTKNPINDFHGNKYYISTSLVYYKSKEEFLEDAMNKDLDNKILFHLNLFSKYTVMSIRPITSFTFKEKLYLIDKSCNLK